MAGTRARLWRPLAILLYASGLAFFYQTYVPLAASFQVVFVPLLVAGGYLAWKDLRKGTLFFIGAFPMAGQYPLTGVGVGAFIIESSNVTNFFQTALWPPESAENLILQIVSETGLVGLLFVIWLIVALARTLRTGPSFRPGTAKPRTRLLAIGASSGLLAFAIDAQMHSYYREPGGPLFALVPGRAALCPVPAAG